MSWGMLWLLLLQQAKTHPVKKCIARIIMFQPWATLPTIWKMLRITTFQVEIWNQISLDARRAKNAASRWCCCVCSLASAKNLAFDEKKNSGFHAVCLHFPELWIFYARLECIILLYHTGNNVDHVVWLTLALFARDKGDKHTIQKKSVDTSSIWHVQAMKSSGMWWRYR